MRYVENGIPEDYAKLCFEGMSVPLCELSDEEYMYIVYGTTKQKKSRRRSIGFAALPDPEPKNELLDKAIDELELSVRPTNCLLRAGIKTLSELCEYTETDIKKLRSMGDKSVAEIKAALSKFGLELKKPYTE